MHADGYEDYSQGYWANNWDVFDMGLEELVKEELVSVNLEKLALHVLYAAYRTEVPAARAQKLFDYFSVSFFRNISIDKMLSIGQEELPDLPDFRDSWRSDCYIIYGEIKITGLNEQFEKEWAFSGEDVFVSKNGGCPFEMVDNIIKLNDWNETYYVIDLNRNL